MLVVINGYSKQNNMQKEIESQDIVLLPQENPKTGQHLNICSREPKRVSSIFFDYEKDQIRLTKENPLMMTWIKDCCKPQYMYITDKNAPIKANDIVTDGHVIEFYRERWNAKDWQKVIASNNPEVIKNSIPSISPEFIQQWVEATNSGKEFKVMTEMEQKVTYESHSYYPTPNGWELMYKISDSNQLILSIVVPNPDYAHPKPETVYRREQVAKDLGVPAESLPESIAHSLEDSEIVKQIVASVHGGNTAIKETNDFIAGVMATIEWYKSRQQKEAIAFMNWTLTADCQYQCVDEDEWNGPDYMDTRETYTTAQVYEFYQEWLKTQTK